MSDPALDPFNGIDLRLKKLPRNGIRGKPCKGLFHLFQKPAPASFQSDLIVRGEVGILADAAGYIIFFLQRNKMRIVKGKVGTVQFMPFSHSAEHKHPAAGKGVIVAMTDDEVKAALDLMFDNSAFGDASSTVLIEEFLVGEEVSLLSFCDGKTALPLPSAQDHKAVFDGDKGPNTGGMGAYSPAPILPDDQLNAMADIVTRPILAEMARRGTPFKGILYAGLMMTADGPKVLEYNVRFGDPECQPLLMRLKSDLVDIMQACIAGELDKVTLDIDERSTLGVVLTSKGYPGSYPKGMPISGIDKANELDGVYVFQAGTKAQDGQILANGGRVLCVTALGKDLKEAQARAYEGMACLSMENSQIRTDIGLKGLKRLGLA